MNPLPDSNQNRNNEKIAKEHWKNILYALTILKEATSGQITNFINNKVEREVKDEFDPQDVSNLGKSNDQLNNERDRELEDRHIDRKTTLKWLKRMVDKGLVKSKNKAYTLTPQGRNEEIFGEYYGRLLYDKLMEMPFKGSIGERLEEYVKRVGIYITYIFMRNSNRAGIQPHYNTVRSDYDEWVNDSISPVVLLEWFNNTFYSKSDSNNYDKLTKVLNSRFNDYINNLEDSEKMYYEKVFPFLYRHSLSMLKKREEKRLDFKS